MEKDEKIQYVTTNEGMENTVMTRKEKEMHKIALFKGNGIGPEITDTAIDIIESLIHAN